MTLDEALWQDKERMSGAVCFRNTRVPLSALFDHLLVGQLREFYEAFPNVSQEMVAAVLEASQNLLISRYGDSSAA